MEAQTDRRYAILSLAGSQNLCQTITYLCFICVTIHLTFILCHCVKWVKLFDNYGALTNGHTDETYFTPAMPKWEGNMNRILFYQRFLLYWVSDEEFYNLYWCTI